jgi:hypothetical protein
MTCIGGVYGPKLNLSHVCRLDYEDEHRHDGSGRRMGGHHAISHIPIIPGYAPRCSVLSACTAKPAVFTLHALWSLQAILFLTICRAYSPPTAQLIFSVRATLLRKLALRHAPRTTRRNLRTAVEVIPARCVLQVSVSRRIPLFHSATRTGRAPPPIPRPLPPPRQAPREVGTSMHQAAVALTLLASRAPLLQQISLPPAPQCPPRKVPTVTPALIAQASWTACS